MLPHVPRARLQKAAFDNGFDIEERTLLGATGEPTWVAFASSGTKLRIWLSLDAEQRPLAAISFQNVADELASYTYPHPIPYPKGAKAVLCAADMIGLHGLLKRVYALSLSLPDDLLHRFQRQTASMPKTTEVERMVVERVGQDFFRRGLLDYWGGQCAITGLAVVELLRASHIKPWAACESDAERLDVHNGLLLAPSYDAAFDKGFLTVDEEGCVVVSSVMREEDVRALGIEPGADVRELGEEHQRYLEYHRAWVFRRG